MSKKILIVTEYFYPSHNSTSFYLTNISKKLAEKNIVKVICNTNIEDKKELNINNLQIIRAKEIKLSKNNVISRTLKFLLSSIKLSILVYKNEKVFSVTNPAFIIVFLAILKKIKKFDVFPENLIAAGILKQNSIVYKLIKKIYDWSYLKADRLVVIGRDMEEVIRVKTNNKID